MDTLLARIFTKPFLVTVLRYALTAAGAWLVANQGFDPGAWETISGALIVIATTLMGGAEAVKDKAVANGKSVPIEALPPAARSEIKEAVAQPRKRRSFFDMLVGK